MHCLNCVLTDHFISFDIRQCETNHHFCNKVWQATRYSLYWAVCLGITSCCEPRSPSLMDLWILSQLGGAVKSITSALETGDFFLVTAAIKRFLYAMFCNVYVVSFLLLLSSAFMTHKYQCWLKINISIYSNIYYLPFYGGNM